jgi:hypothetical protein
MRRNPDFLLRDVAGTKVIVPIGAAVTAFPGMITVNDTGAYLWELLETEQTVDSLADALLARYEVAWEQAKADVEMFLEKLQPTGAVVG